MGRNNSFLINNQNMRKTTPAIIQDFTQKHPWLPYVAPFFLFIILTEAARWLPSSFSPWLYGIKTMLTALLLWWFWPDYRHELKNSLSFSGWITSIFCGLLVLFIWIAGESILPTLGESTKEIAPATTFFIAVRLLGSSFIVPLMEELFWRSFLMRYLINRDFRGIAPGSFGWFSFLVTAVLFGSEHHRIGAGIIAGLLYGALLLWQKNLRGVIIAHMVTNFGLGIYIIITNSWFFW